VKRCLLGLLSLVVLALPSIAGGERLAYDPFEYVVERDQPGASAAFAANGPWNGAKTLQDGRTGAKGYVYTTDVLPGYSGSFPGQDSKRVLCLEALPARLQGQTDFYIQYGSARGPLGQIPANVWFQFWVYINRSNGQASNILGSKFIYPSCDGVYPATNRNAERGNCTHWLFCLGNHSKEPFSARWSDGQGFFCNRPPNADFTSASEYPTNRDKLGPNLGKAADFTLQPNHWYLVKVHIDTSGKSPLVPVGQGVYEVWMREKDQSWTKTTEWLGCKTPNFTWPLLPQADDGNKTIPIPTTVGGTKGKWADYWLYLDDFAMATVEGDLPEYDP